MVPIRKRQIAAVDETEGNNGRECQCKESIPGEGEGEVSGLPSGWFAVDSGKRPGGTAIRSESARTRPKPKYNNYTYIYINI